MKIEMKKHTLTYRLLNDILLIGKTFPYTSYWFEDDKIHFLIHGVEVSYDFSIKQWVLDDITYWWFPESDIKQKIDINYLISKHSSLQDILFIPFYEKQSI